jgi:hypothetical protein
MRRLTDGERDILREQVADAAASERAWGREMTEDEIDDVCAEFDAVFGEWLSTRVDPDDDTREPY